MSKINLKDEAFNNPEFSAAADNLLNVCRIHLAKHGNSSPTAKELLDICKTVLEKRT